MVIQDANEEDDVRDEGSGCGKVSCCYALLTKGSGTSKGEGGREDVWKPGPVRSREWGWKDGR